MSKKCLKYGVHIIDVYIPELKVTIEYMGAQHYLPIDHFGGKEALVRTQERDRKKLRLCKANGVKLLYVKYTDSVELSFVMGLLEKVGIKFED